MLSKSAAIALGSVIIATAVCSGTTAADAKCTRLSFTVNDYGKDGPTKDAKDLLDKYIVNWTKEKGIKTYSVGKKDVKCELFLNFIVFDEHTCQASASVCWEEGAAPSATPASSPAVKKTAPKPPVAKKAQIPN
jgi:hypothetical protein